MNPNHQASRDRQEIAQRIQELRWLSGLTQERSPLLRASIYKRKRRCGKTGCRCFKGRLHQGTVLEVRRAGKSFTRTLKADALGETLGLVNNWRRFQETRAMMMVNFKKLMKAVDRLAQMRMAEALRESSVALLVNE